MKGDEKALSSLNDILTNKQLTAVNQYFLHAPMSRHGGLHDLGVQSYRQFGI